MKKVIDASKDDHLLNSLLKDYCHPSIAFWRAVEIRTILENLDQTPLQDSILDLGCGEGKVSREVFRNRLVDLGLELDINVAIEAKKDGFYRYLVIANAEQLPLKNNSYNIVFCNCVIEHIPDCGAVLDGVMGILKKGGHFIFSVPSEKFGEYLFFHQLFRFLGLRSLAKKYSNKRNQLLNHYHCYSPEVWRKKLRRHGFKLIKYSYYLPKSAIMVWDLLATIIFVFKKIYLWEIFVKSCSRWSFLDKLRVKFFQSILLRYYLISSQTGGGLVLIAGKLNETN